MQGLEVSMLCRLSKVSRSGYYYWIKAKEEKIKRDKDDLDLITKIFNKKHQKAGWRTIKMILENKYQVFMNHKKIRRIMREYGLKTKIRRKNPYRELAQKTQEHSSCNNLLNRNFKIKKPDSVYSTDITYLHYANGQRAFLSAIKDLATGEILAHTLSRQINIDFVNKMLDKILEFLPKEKQKGLMIHSDQGVHYTHPTFRLKLKESGIVQSMSRKGNCLDNAPIESFFGHFKDEIDYKKCKTFEELKDKIDEYIYYYNNERYQWSKNKMTPAQYRSHLLIA